MVSRSRQVASFPGGAATADHNTSTFEAEGIRVYFYSQRAKVNSDPTKHLSDFINGANRSLLGAIYDLEHPEILKALKNAAGRLSTHLHVVYGAGKSKSRQADGTADPKRASATCV